MTKAQKQRFDDMLPSAQAGILCNDPRFQTFAALRCDYPGRQFTSGAAAEYVRQVCQVSSRCDLLHDQAAAKRFQALRTEFDAWTGKIATPDR